MQIDIQFVPSPLKPYLLSNRAVVVIDALRDKVAGGMTTPYRPAKMRRVCRSLTKEDK